MKAYTKIKTVFLCLTLAIFILLGAASCNNDNNKKAEDTKDVAETHNDAKFDDKKEKDAQFLVNAGEINLEEIKLGELAQQNAKIVDTKELGKMMVDAHKKAWADLTELAKKKNVTLPAAATDKANDAYKKLSDKSMTKFDKEYCDMMVDGHKDAIAMFEKASNESADADIKQWATAMLPELRTHLDHALACQKKCEEKMNK